jgi:hypothetical protein
MIAMLMGLRLKLKGCLVLPRRLFPTSIPVCALFLCWGVPTHGSETDDRVLLMHADGSYESAYAWQYGGNVAPDYGAFAERYEGAAWILSVVVDLTSLGYSDMRWVDAYVWEDTGGMPGAVLRVVPHIEYYSAGFWPYFARNNFELPDPVCTGSEWWVGYWGDYGGAAAFYVGADLDGPGSGASATKVAPGQGYPTGWQDVSMKWGPTAALGIGADVDSCPPTPVESETWGSIKALFR